MERDNRHLVSLLYGYAVCIIAIVVGFISTASIVDAVFDLKDPIRSTSYTGSVYYNLSTFEAFKLEARSGKIPTVELHDGAYGTLSDNELQSIYVAARDDKVAGVRHHAQKELVTSGLIFAIAGLLFLFHWRWLTRIKQEA
jgi:hypothetical protein